nr:hypothetical protein [Tanacetum cinerariifolium]
MARQPRDCSHVGIFVPPSYLKFASFALKFQVMWRRVLFVSNVFQFLSFILEILDEAPDFNCKVRLLIFRKEHDQGVMVLS